MPLAPHPAVVLQASGPNALGIVRGLARADVPVIACDHDPRALGMVSRHTTPWPTRDPLADPDGFVDDLCALGARLARPGVLFPTHDEALEAIGPREGRLEGLFLRPWSPWAVMSRVLDKSHQHVAARAIGFPVPRTLTPDEATDPAVVEAELRFPVVLKPSRSAEFKRALRVQVLEAADPEQLRRVWDRAAPYRPAVSEVIPGGDELIWSLGSYRDAAGSPLASFTGRKLRQWPPRFGTGRSAESRWDAGLARRGHELLDALAFHGISQLETKRDPRDGRHHLIEVNARSWLWVGLATAAGVNLPLAAYLDAVGRPRTWEAGHRDGLRWMLSTRHLPAGLREVRRREWGAGAFARSLRPPIRDGVIDLRDPRPMAELVRRHALRLARRRHYW